MLFWLNHILLPPHPLQFLIPSNLLIEFLLHLVDEIGAAGILAQFDGGVVAVTLLGVESEELVEGRGEHLQGCLSVVNAAHLAQPVNQFHEVEGVARPLQGLWRFAFGGSNIGWMDVGYEWWHFGVVLAGELHHLADEGNRLLGMDAHLFLNDVYQEAQFYLGECQGDMYVVHRTPAHAALDDVFHEIMVCLVDTCACQLRFPVEYSEEVCPCQYGVFFHAVCCYEFDT